MLSRYFILKEAGDFQESDYPHVVSELAAIKIRVMPVRHVNKELVIVSYLRDHLLREALWCAYPKLINALTHEITDHYLEDLFAASKEHSQFRISLENYVIDQLNK